MMAWFGGLDWRYQLVAIILVIGVPLILGQLVQLLFTRREMKRAEANVMAWRRYMDKTFPRE